jgi:integrase
MGSIRALPGKGTLFMDFRFAGNRLREYTMLSDTPANRKRLQKVLDRIETEIALGAFDYATTFGKPLPAQKAKSETEVQAIQAVKTSTPLFKDFANQWYQEAEVTWRRSYKITQRGVLDKYLIPYFGVKEVGSITKADILEFRALLAKVTARKSDEPLSNRRINAILKPLRQILNEAADRHEFTSAFRNIKPLKMKRSDVQPFTLDEVELILKTARSDYKNYFTVRFFTGMRTGEVHGLKWKYIDFERRLILVRESIVLNEDDQLKTEDSMRDIQMSQLVYDALKAQYQASRELSEYVFCNQAGQPIDNQNFLNRIWNPLLRHLNLPHRRAYQMRHTAATLWLAAGEAPEWIARQLGHTSTEMLFRVYSRYVPNLTRQDGSAMERLLASRLSTGSVLEQLPAVQPARALQDGTTGLPVLRTPPRLHSIEGGRSLEKRPDNNSATDYFGDSKPQPPPWNLLATEASGRCSPAAQ